MKKQKATTCVFVKGQGITQAECNEVVMALGSQGFGVIVADGLGYIPGLERGLKIDGVIIAGKIEMSIHDIREMLTLIPFVVVSEGSSPIFDIIYTQNIANAPRLLVDELRAVVQIEDMFLGPMEVDLKDFVELSSVA